MHYSEEHSHDDAAYVEIELAETGAPGHTLNEERHKQTAKENLLNRARIKAFES